MTGTHWNHVDSRAIIPHSGMKSSRDVILAKPTDITLSPSAFGLGVYSCGHAKQSEEEDDSDSDEDEDGINDLDPTVAKPMPLVYVSPAVASARVGTCPPINPGWYLTATPGQEFEVRVSPTAGAESVNNTCPTADVLIMSVHVDGVDASPGGFAFQQSTVGCEARFRGFVESFSRNTDGGLCVLRRFSFRKADLTEGQAEPVHGTAVSADGYGTIRLVVESANTSGLRKGAEERRFGARKVDPVNERDALKKGTSLGVERMGKKMTVGSNSFRYSITDRMNRPECDIVINIRERFWMESRRLIDSTGRPCTEAMSNDMLISTQGPSKRATIELDGPSGKRVRKDRVKPEPAEVIDLTNSS